MVTIQIFEIYFYQKWSNITTHEELLFNKANNTLLKSKYFTEFTFLSVSLVALTPFPEMQNEY